MAGAELTSTIRWRCAEKNKPEDRQYVLGAFEGRYDDGTPFSLVFAMHYRARDSVYVDADGVERSTTTDSRITYWAESPEHPNPQL